MIRFRVGTRYLDPNLMCGIAGIVDTTHRLGNPSQLIETMLDWIQHRGPDDWGKWTSSDGLATLGHRRLSILDTSAAGRQPFTSLSGRFHLTFNGEIYNFQDIRSELGNVELSSTGDTAVAAAAFDKWGIMPAVQRFNGMFALGVWDQQERQLYLIRDRFGKKPVYYGHVNGIFAFASELKPLHAIDGFCNDICPNAVEELLKFGYIASPRSVFKNIKKLKAGEYLKLDCRKDESVYSTEIYWEPTQDRPNEIPDQPEEFLDMLESLMIDSVRMRMISDVPLGAFLSGGIDSSMVCALMAKVASGPVKTFTIGFNEKAYNEAEDAKKIANLLGTEHHEHYLSGTEAIDLVQRIPEIYTEPFADSSQLPTYLVSQLARQNVTVALSGDGGDELFSGYSRYQSVLNGWQSKNTVKGRAITQSLNLARKIAPGLVSQMALSRTKRSFGKWGSRKTFDRELERRNANRFSDYYGLNNSAYSIADSFLSDEFSETRKPLQPIDWTIFGDNRVEMSVHDLHYYLPEDILAKVDRASMAVSLETRNPILDYRLVGPSMAALQKYSESTDPKWAIKSILAKHIPVEYFDRPKQGFGIPVEQWLGAELKPWVSELINVDRLNSEGFFNSSKVSNLWQEFLAGDTITWGAIVWRLVMFQAWHDNFFSSAPPRTAHAAESEENA